MMFHVKKLLLIDVYDVFDKKNGKQLASIWLALSSESCTFDLTPFLLDRFYGGVSSVPYGVGFQ